MNRRAFLQNLPAVAVTAYASGLLDQRLSGAEVENPTSWIDPARAKDWLARWEKNIVGDARNRYCDKEMGEELGWHVSPFLNGFHYGYRATHDLKWVERLVDWADSCIQRGVKEPDGFIGWPIPGGGGGNAGDFSTDSLLGEAMMLRPVVLMAGEILKTPALKEKWESKARSYVELAEQMFQKWDSRDCWREVKDGGLWVVPVFGLDPRSGQWTEGYARRKSDGFSNPDNKQHHIAG